MEKWLDVTYYHHSGFSAAMDDVLLVFDYWLGEKGELPENKRLSAMYFGLSMIIALLTQKLYTLMTRQYILRRRDKVRRLFK